MNIDIRKSIQENFKGTNVEEIESAIVESISTKEELALPGLGVFFEVLWNQSGDKEKQTILETIIKGL